MIGQQKLLDKVNKLLDNFPRFIIIVGDKNSGKKTLCNHISKLLQATPIYFENRIDEVRRAIDLAYTQQNKMVYIFPDADHMSVAGKNSMLKITEEPPKNAYFILTLTNLENMLATIQSRGVVLKLDPYTKQELIEFRKSRNLPDNYDNIITSICNTTGDVIELFSYDVNQFNLFCDNVSKRIQVPTSGNTFKITKMLKIKDTDTNGFDCYLFLKTVQIMFLNLGKLTKKRQYFDASIVTSKYIQEIRLGSVSKLGTIDMWIMDVRRQLKGV